MGPDAPARASALFLATAIHVALGWALLSHLAAGTPVHGDRDRSHGNGLVMELLPLEQDGAKHAGDSAATRNGAAPGRPHIAARGAHATPEPPVEIHVGAGAGRDSGATATPLLARTTSDLPAAEILAYRARLQEHLGRYRAYPPGARAAGQEGVVQVHFAIDHAGRVLDAWVESGSGVDEIDHEAIAAILRAQPLPALPGAWPERLEISLPITFKIG